MPSRAGIEKYRIASSRINMEKYVLLVVPASGYSGLAHITFDVILKENSIEVVTATSVAGAVKSDDEGSSIMTLDFKTVLAHESEFAGAVLIGGGSIDDLSRNEALKTILSDLHSAGSPIVALDNASKILDGFGISGDNVITSEGDYERVAEQFVSKF